MPATTLTRDEIAEKIANKQKAIARCGDEFLKNNLRSDITHYSKMLREMDEAASSAQTPSEPSGLSSIGPRR